MRFIECEEHNTYVNIESIESIWYRSNLGSGDDHLMCTANTGENYILYTADKEKIDYLKTRLVLALTRESEEKEIIDLETL